MSSSTREPKCPACEAGLDRTTCVAESSERAPYGDEFTDELHQCSACGAWSMVTLIDRFAAADEINVAGPLSMREVRLHEQRLKR